MVNTPKLILAIVFMCCLTLLMALQRMDAVAGAGMMGILAGYITGNGVTARKDQPMEPIIGRQHEEMN